jgi:hypothetical protein
MMIEDSVAISGYPQAGDDFSRCYPAMRLQSQARQAAGLVLQAQLAQLGITLKLQ